MRAAFRPHCSGCPFPSPHLKGAGIGNSGTSPRPRFEGCTRQPSGQEAHSANLFRKECQGCNEARKPSCPAPQFNLPRRLSAPSHGSAFPSSVTGGIICHCFWCPNQQMQSIPILESNGRLMMTRGYHVSQQVS